MPPPDPATVPNRGQSSRPPRGAAGYRRLAGNTIATLGGRGAAIVLALALSTVLFRVLGQERFGLWSLFAFLVGYSALVDFGLSAAVERQAAWLETEGRAADIPRTIGQALMLVVAATLLLHVLITAGAFVAGRWFGRPIPIDVLRGLRVLPLALALMTGSLVVGSGLSGLQRMVALYAWRTAGMVVSTAVASALAVSGIRRLDVLLLGYAAGAPLAAVGQWWSLSSVLPAGAGRHEGGSAWRWHGPSVRELIGFGGVLQVATIGPMLGEYAFRLIVTRRFGVEYAGIYDLAARAALGLRSLAAALFVAMVPFGVKLLASADRTDVARLLRLAVKYTALFMLPCSALLLVTAEPVVRVWLGSGQGAELVAITLRPLIVLHAVISLTVPMAMIGRASGQPSPEAVTTWAGVVLGVGAAALTGQFPAAVVLFASAPLAAGIALWVWLSCRIRIRFDGWKDLLGAGAVTAVAGTAALGGRAAAAWADLPAWGAVVVAAFAWAAAGAGATVALGLIGPRERGVLRSVGSPGEPT